MELFHRNELDMDCMASQKGQTKKMMFLWECIGKNIKKSTQIFSFLSTENNDQDFARNLNSELGQREHETWTNLKSPPLTGGA